MLMRASSVRHPHRSGSGIVIAQGILILLLLLGALAYQEYEFDPFSLIYFNCCVLALSSIWMIWSWKKLTGKTFDPYTLFLFAAMLFNGGQAFLELFNLNSNGILDNIFPSETIIYTLFIVTLGIASFHFGALLSTYIGLDVEYDKNYDKELIKTSLRYVGWGLILLTIGPAMLVFRDSISVVTSTGYAGLYQQESATSFGAAPQILANFLMPGAIFLLAGSKDKKSGRIGSIIIILSYVLLQFFLGLRATAVMPLLAYVWLWHRCIRPLPKTALISLALVLLLVVFPIVRAVRNDSGNDRFAVNRLVDAYISIDNPVIEIISEMGGSMITIAYTLDLIPSYKAFDAGAEYGYALLTLMPNLFWSIHPTIAHGLPNQWLIWTVSPDSARSGGGLGFSFIAEAYFNFGWFGTPIILMVFGFLFAMLRLWSLSAEPLDKMAFFASFTAFMLFWVRQEATVVFRPLVWYALIPYLGVQVVRSILLRSSMSKKRSIA